MKACFNFRAPITDTKRLRRQDERRRKFVLRQIRKLLDREDMRIVEGRLHLGVPLGVYFAHVSTGTLEAAFLRARRAAYEVLRAEACHDGCAFDAIGANDMFKPVAEADEIGASVGLVRDFMESGVKGAVDDASDALGTVWAAVGRQGGNADNGLHERPEQVGVFKGAAFDRGHDGSSDTS